MRADVLAVGTELLLGHIVDSNSAWIGEQLASVGVDSYEHRVVGDNQERIVEALTDLVRKADAVVVCGGLGPTPDDVTRDALAELMGAPLVRHEELVEQIASRFAAREIVMPENNLRQAEVPEGADPIPNLRGTAPGLRCSIGATTVYALPGVPREMYPMMLDHVVPDLIARSERLGTTSVILSRVLKTWGVSESALAEMLASRVQKQTNPTIAFLTRGIEGIVVRVTAKAATDSEARCLLDVEERELRALLGNLVFGVDDETMEHAVLCRLRARGETLGVAESLTGGLVGARLVNVPGASTVFRGTIGSYATDVKRSVLGVSTSRVVSEEAAAQMALGARRVLAADVGIAVTGVAGPESTAGEEVGTVCFGVSWADGTSETLTRRLPGERRQVRELATITLLDFLRVRLDQRG